MLLKKIPTPENISKQAQAFYAQETLGIPEIDSNSLAEVQALRTAIHGQWEMLCDQIPYEYNFDEISINGIRCYQIDPPEASSDDLVIIYIHGGTYFFGHPTNCKNIPVSIAHNSGIRVISVEYRLSPEHVFPAPAEDILAVIDGIQNYFGKNCRYGLSGHSSGGGLALSVALQAMEKGLACPEALALLAPWVEMELCGDTMLSLEEFDPSPTSRDWFYKSVEDFLGNYQRTDPLVSPLYGDFSDLCPIYIQQAGRDKLLSDATRLNRRLLKANVQSTLDIWDGLWHGFQMFPLLPEAQQANQATAAFLKANLEKKG
jgi:acetyl esterase/lipase